MFKKIIMLVSSLALAVALVFVLLPEFALKPKEETNTNKSSFVGRTEYDGQVVYASDDTGASEVDSSQKGGAIFLGEGTSYTMTGGTITGLRKEFGGAFYVSKNATLTINGGTIESCQAKYGGAIYVASGGTCIINGGNITNNYAENAPAIYVENSGKLVFGDGQFSIKNNQTSVWLAASETKENVGGLNSGLELYTITFGSYPQTYVGNSMREELENWFSSESPELVKTYETGDGRQWNAYEYNGDLYARGTETKYGSDSVYKDGTSPTTNRTSWFKVEPIKWYILNYDAWQSGKESMELYSTQILTAKTPFNSTTSKGNNWGTSDIRTWCNENFYNIAFSSDERELIELTTLKNNVTNEYSKDPSTWTGENTEDKIYLKTYYELYDSNGLFTNNSKKRLCSGTDFAIGNNLVCAGGTSYATNYGVKGGSYWLRSAGSAASYACYVNTYGILLNSYYVNSARNGVRPALHLDL